MDIFSGSAQLLDVLLPNVDEQDLHLLSPPQFATGSSRIIDCKFKINEFLQK